MAASVCRVWAKVPLLTNKISVHDRARTGKGSEWLAPSPVRYANEAGEVCDGLLWHLVRGVDKMER
jgi:hypothetical protein